MVKETLVAAAIVDDDGEKLFSAKEVAAWAHVLIDDLFDQVLEINNAKAQVEELAGNSIETPGLSSGSS